MSGVLKIDAEVEQYEKFNSRLSERSFLLCLFKADPCSDCIRQFNFLQNRFLNNALFVVTEKKIWVEV